MSEALAAVDEMLLYDQVMGLRFLSFHITATHTRLIGRRRGAPEGLSQPVM
jgi:hypothetical protein